MVGGRASISWFMIFVGAGRVLYGAPLYGGGDQGPVGALLYVGAGIPIWSPNG